MRSYSPQHKQEKDWSRIRLALVAGLFGLVWLVLWGRAFQVQVLDGDMLAERARRQHLASEFINGERGRILDRHGRILAQSVQCQSVYARPVQVKNPAQAARSLSRVLNIPANKLVKKLSSRRPFVWLKRQVSDKVAFGVRSLDIGGISLVKEYRRLYPNKWLAGQLLGFCGQDGHGLEGLERSLNTQLTGVQNRQIVQRDARGRKLYLDGEQESPSHGQDVRLTLDADIQAVAEQALSKVVSQYNGKSGVALVAEVESGDILAWAQYPLFNPNSYRQYRSLGWRNRVALDALEPGSTLKPFLIAAALQEGIVAPETAVYCENGRFRLDGVTIRDTHKYEDLSVAEVLKLSSNIGMAKIGLEMGASRYYDYLTKLGFGSRSGLKLPESKGILRNPGTWQRVDLAATSFGQGIAVTALQTARAYVCLADDGVLKPLRLFAGQQPTQPERAVFSPEVTHTVLGMLQAAVEEGTGKRARIEGLTVGGKTGTAQKASRSGGYGKKYLASFVGMIPATHPRYVVLVSVDEPHPVYYGGLVAAPAVREIALKSLAFLGELPEVMTEAASPDSFAAPRELERAVQAAVHRSPDVRNPLLVPDVVGLSLRQAVKIFADAGVMPDLRGTGYIIGKQSPPPGTPWKSAGQAVFWLMPEDGRS
ncbi:penicillin-binding protein [Desulfobaculum bizertense]|uniref:Cell division protein FtsI (Penicillin-binding protein 3) n=1 Tax=Desulfobaculum bizertense DSM 18034 TaxID=1121442 RepID=A0A1T4VXE3_9BACT|nr:penicillin-binding protein [Desulfobaculum bizertense]UIJ36928.1 transpeptidase family protein [Desulfobaculum bizertense]SKA69680.1 cell division protein FtsI (penicillin-binding protein 3) [Desulfobaculum bizertense DSM 18034]